MSSEATSGQVITPELSCLLDCFPEESDPGYCITELVRDMVNGETCQIEGNPGTWGTTDGCTIATCADFNVPPGCSFCDTLTAGTCSAETVEFLALDECRQTFQEQPALIKHTLLIMIQYSCVINPFSVTTGPTVPTGPTGPKGPIGPIRIQSSRSRSNDKPVSSWLAPVSEVNVVGGYKTELDYTLGCSILNTYMDFSLV